MDGADRLERRKTLAERLGWKGMACCGATWAIRSSTISIRDDEDEDVVGPLQPQQQQNQQEEEEQQIEVIDVGRIPPETNSDPGCDGEGPVVSGMNLADALAAERQFRAADLDGGSGLSSPVRPNSDVTAQETPLRVSLMRLLEETDGGDGAEEVEKGEKGVGNDSVCCVCMGRKKGAAFIPCGHTFCRVCSRELWLNRGSCPLCNRPIVEILDIF